MKLYHGTSTRFLKNIMKNGITPRVINDNDNWKHAKTIPSSRPEYVYLTKFFGFGLFFGNNACGDSDNAFPIIIEVNVDTNQLEQDDDMVTIGRRYVPDFNTDAKGSLKVLGTVAHRGVIDVKNFTRIYVILDIAYCLNFEKDGFNSLSSAIEDAKTPNEKKAYKWLRKKIIKEGGILSYGKPFNIDYTGFKNKSTLNKEISVKYRTMAYPSLFNKDGNVKNSIKKLGADTNENNIRQKN